MQRNLILLSLVVLFGIFVAGWGWLQRREASHQAEAIATSQADEGTSSQDQSQAAQATATNDPQATAETEIEAVRATVTIQAQAAATAQAEAGSEYDKLIERYQFTLARQLGVQAQLELSQNPDPVLGTLLAAESLRRFQTIEGDIPLRRGLELLSWQTVFTAPKKASCGGVIGLSADNRLLATYSVSCRYSYQDISIEVWDITTGQKVSQLSDPDSTSGKLMLSFYGGELSPDGRWLTTDSPDSVRVWDATTGKIIKRITTDYGSDLSPDGRWLIIPKAKNALSVLDATTLQEVHQIKLDGDTFLRQFTPDGQLFVTATATDTLDFWNPATGQRANQLQHKDLNLWRISFSPDGQLLAAMGKDEVGIRIWDVAATRELTQTAHGVKIQHLAFSPDNHWLATTGNNVQVWDLSTGLETARMVHQGDSAYDVTFSPDGRWLASGGNDALRVWEVGTWREVARMGGGVGVISFSTNSQKLIASGTRFVGQVWQFSPDQTLAKTLSQDNFNKISYSPDGRWIAAGNSQGIYFWEPAAGTEVARLEPKNGADIFEISPDNQRLAISTGDNTVEIWEVLQNRQISQLNHPARVDAMAFSPDSQQLVSLSGQVVRLWDVETGREVSHLAIQTEGTGNIIFALSPGGRRVALSQFPDLVIWDVLTGQEIGRFKLRNSPERLVFSADGRLLAEAGSGSVHILDVDKAQQLAFFDYLTSVAALAFSPGGRWLAIGTSFFDLNWHSQGQTRLVDTTKAQIVLEFPSGAVSTLAFSPDSHWLATGDRIWDINTEREVARLSLPYGIQGISFSTDNHQLMVLGGEGSPIQLWAWQAPDLVAAACARLPRNLTRVEWRDYVGEEAYQATCPNLPVPEK